MAARIAYHRMPGPGDLPGDSSHPNSPDFDGRAQERRTEDIDGLLSDPAWVAAHTAEADEWSDGTFDGEHYSAVERALADLAEVPAEQLVGSDALAAVLRLAAIHGDARATQLREIAERIVDRERDQCDRRAA